MSTITGAILLGASEQTASTTFDAINPATGEAIGPAFSEAGKAEVEQACALAEQAFPMFSELEPEKRAAFLERVADGIVAIGDELIERAMAETGLPRPRLEGERGRTVGQLRLFANVVREGRWLDVVIEPALPDRQPLPRPDLRRRNVALGPVAVFGASNFPLAFSVAGGDTASALAAGCPVVVKGHPAHPGTGELVARAIQAAVKEADLPEGVFSFLPGTTNDLGGALVADSRIRAVGFTGSRGGGMALVRIAAEREEPIPVYAEMSAINPVVLFPEALKARGQVLGQQFVASLTMGAGQFCTNPGLVIAVSGPDLDAFQASAAAALGESKPQQMLTPGIHKSYEQGVAALEGHNAVTVVARGCVGEGQAQARGALFRTDGQSFLADRALGHEVFGSSSVIVAVDSLDEVKTVIDGLEGQLTATLMIDEGDQAEAAKIIPALARRAGRVLANGWPTGVEVSHAMVHGGPFPATSDGRTTSVGTLAIERFLRPVCYQAIPEALLPPAVQDANPWGVEQRRPG
jgi:NADP-dependent aldehyde dehydrogenase